MTEPGQHGSPPEVEPREAGRVELAAVVCRVGAEVLISLLWLDVPLWIAGNVMLVTSTVWTWTEKRRGWLSLASGYPLIVTVMAAAASCAESETCTANGPWIVVVATLLGAFFVLQILTVRRLLNPR